MDEFSWLFADRSRGLPRRSRRRGGVLALSPLARPHQRTSEPPSAYHRPVIVDNVDTDRGA
jgi:hypothetical protein